MQSGGMYSPTLGSLFRPHPLVTCHYSSDGWWPCLICARNTRPFTYQYTLFWKVLHNHLRQLLPQQECRPSVHNVREISTSGQSIRGSGLFYITRNMYIWTILPVSKIDDFWIYWCSLSSSSSFFSWFANAWTASELHYNILNLLHQLCIFLYSFRKLFLQAVICHSNNMCLGSH
jgi:hypothetical protein